MNIRPEHLSAIRRLGYTDTEASFLYLVATHSGYFMARQFLSFTGAHWGKRTTLFWAKLQTNRHARTEGVRSHADRPGSGRIGFDFTMNLGMADPGNRRSPALGQHHEGADLQCLDRYVAIRRADPCSCCET